MSSDTIAVGIFTIAGTLLGTLAGFFMERYWRTRGEVSCSTRPLRWLFRYRTYGNRPPYEQQEFFAQYWTRTMKGLGSLGRGDLAQATSVTNAFVADFYNGKEVPSGLRDFKILFYRPDDTPIVDNDLRGTLEAEPEPLRVVNLPPKQLVSIEVSGKVPESNRLEGCTDVQMRAEFPDGREFVQDVARLDPGVVLVLDETSAPPPRSDE
jgi:hypothetical protein